MSINTDTVNGVGMRGSKHFATASAQFQICQGVI
jgi:hypothetical protein